MDKESFWFFLGALGIGVSMVLIAFAVFFLLMFSFG